MDKSYALDERTVLKYLANCKVDLPISVKASPLKVSQIKEGNVNLIFRVYNPEDKKESVLVKQALPYAWRYPDFKMPRRRAFLEAKLLRMYDGLYPGIVPKLYFFDRAMYLNIMEDLRDHEVMREGLSRQGHYPGFSKKLGIFIARKAFYTSALYLGREDIKKYKKTFQNPVMAKVTLDLVFTEPVKDSPNNKWTKGLEKEVLKIKNNRKITMEAKKLKNTFLSQKDTLLHGDLHTGSVMVKKDDVKVIDPEFSLYGPFGFDLGSMIANLIISYTTQDYYAKDKNIVGPYKNWLLDCIENIYIEFIRELERLIIGKNSSEDLSGKGLFELFSNTLGFAALEIIRRTIGLAHISDFINIKDKRSKIKIETTALKIATQLITRRNRFRDIEEVIFAIQKI